MPSPSNLAVLATLTLMAACDPGVQGPEPRRGSEELHPEDLAQTSQSISDSEPSITFENNEDFAIMNDTSNLRRPDVPEDEYLRTLRHRTWEELRSELPDVILPGPDSLEPLSVRWFARGTGVVAQNNSLYKLSLTASFESSKDDECQIAVAWKQVAPAGATVLEPDDSGCIPDRAVLTVNNEYGGFVGLVHVPQSGTSEVLR